MEIGFHQLDKPPAAVCDTPTGLIHSGLPPFDEVTVFLPREGKSPEGVHHRLQVEPVEGSGSRGKDEGPLRGLLCPTPNLPLFWKHSIPDCGGPLRTFIPPKLTVFLPPSMSSWPRSNPTPSV